MVWIAACSDYGLTPNDDKADSADPDDADPDDTAADNNSGFDLPGFCFEAEEARRLERPESEDGWDGVGSEPGTWCRLISLPRTDHGDATEFDAAGRIFSSVLAVGVLGSEFPGASTEIRVAAEVANPDILEDWYPMYGNFYTGDFLPVEGGSVDLDSRVDWFATAVTAVELGAINDCTGDRCLWEAISTEIRDGSVATDADCEKYLREVTCLVEAAEDEAESASKSAAPKPKNACVPGRGTFAFAPTGRMDKVTGRSVAQPILVHGSGYFSGASRLRSVTFVGRGSPDLVALDRRPLADAGRRRWLSPSASRRLALTQPGRLPADAPPFTGYTRFLAPKAAEWSWKDGLAELAWDCDESESDRRVAGRGRRLTLPIARLGCAVDISQELTIELAAGGRDAYVALAGLEDRALHMKLTGGSERSAFDMSQSGLKVRGEFVKSAEGQPPRLDLYEVAFGGVPLCSVGEFALDER